MNGTRGLRPFGAFARDLVGDGRTGDCTRAGAGAAAGMGSGSDVGGSNCS